MRDLSSFHENMENCTKIKTLHPYQPRYQKGTAKYTFSSDTMNYFHKCRTVLVAKTTT